MNNKERIPLQVGLALVVLASVFFTTEMTFTFQTHPDWRAILVMLIPFVLLPLLIGILLICKYLNNQRLARQKRLLRTIIWKGHITDLARISENMGITIDETVAFAEIVAKEDSSTSHRMKVNKDQGYLEINQPWAKARHYHCPDCTAESWINIGLDLTCPYCGSAVR